MHLESIIIIIKFHSLQIRCNFNNAAELYTYFARLTQNILSILQLVRCHYIVCRLIYKSYCIVETDIQTQYPHMFQ